MKIDTQGRVMGLIAFISMLVGGILTTGEFCQPLLASSLFGLFVMVLASSE